MPAVKPRQKQTPFQQMAEAMADELERNRLDVVVTPTEGRPVRTVMSANPEWYQKFCAQHTSGRKDSWKWQKHKTSIKRRATLKALRALAAGVKQRSDALYAGRLRAVIRQEMARDREEFLAARRAAAEYDKVPF